MASLFETAYNPDVLGCLANLSNDEVFTPPEIVNQMLDTLPEELWHDPNAKFLDPACKSGVFLREIAKRLIDGLESEYPDLDERLEHIFKEQLYGIAITELTSLLSRRSLYCSKYPSSVYSVVLFDNPEGNIRFKASSHKWYAGRCAVCGASQKEYEREGLLEQHAYEFIHLSNWDEVYKMKFDVVVGNPPYQLSDGGSKASASPIYHKFVEQAIKLNPRYLTMIIPARWFAGGKGLDAFREKMLNDQRIRHMTDYFDSTECFPGVDISGGICYFLWDRDNPGQCVVESHRATAVSSMERPLLEKGSDVFIRFNESIDIVRKIQEKNRLAVPFSSHISSRKPFGLTTKPSTFSAEKSSQNHIKCYSFPKNGFVDVGEVSQNKEWVNKIKVCISYAYGERGEFPYFVIGKPFIIEPGAVCTETYLVVGVFDVDVEARNMISYMQTKLFRFLVLQKKNTQHATKNVYALVPEQSYKEPWSDKRLYEEYGLTDEEINFVESTIRSMDAGSDDE